VDLGTVATLMGHQRLNTTVIYTQPGARDLEQAVARLEHDNDLPPTTRRKGGEGWMINETNYQIEMCTDGKHRAIVTFEDPGGSKAAIAAPLSRWWDNRASRQSRWLENFDPLISATHQSFSALPRKCAPPASRGCCGQTVKILLC